MITTQRSKRLDGELYDNQDPNLLKEHLNVQILLHKYNHTLPHKAKTRKKLLQKILGHAPSDIVMEQPFYCDFGYNIFIGEHFYSNYNLTILDCNKVTIGDRCLIGPGVSIITVNHPLHRASRASHLEYAKPIVIGDDVWIGCGAIINPGVTIGDNVVIGSGSIVTRDIPSNSLAVGTPARVIRKLE